MKELGQCLSVGIQFVAVAEAAILDIQRLEEDQLVETLRQGPTASRKSLKAPHHHSSKQISSSQLFEDTLHT